MAFSVVAGSRPHRAPAACLNGPLKRFRSTIRRLSFVREAEERRRGRLTLQNKWAFVASQSAALEKLTLVPTRAFDGRIPIDLLTCLLGDVHAGCDVTCVPVRTCTGQRVLRSCLD